MKPLDLSENVPWKKRYTVPQALWATVATGNPARGLVCHNRTGKLQLYGWETDSASLTQLTDRAKGQQVGVIDANGAYIYYLQDEAGNEQGHFMQIPFAGGEPVDITPALAPYSTWQISTAADGRHLAFIASGRDGFQLMLLERAIDGALSEPRCNWRSKALTIGPWLNHDGSVVLVATPAGEGSWPLILHTHGGPTSVMTNVFQAEAQSWLDHGFAFLSVNYRGSITFGKAYEEAIWGNLGEWEIDDMAAARAWAVANGIAQPEAVLLIGGSYGGYLTLQAMGRRPDRLNCSRQS